MDGDFLFLRHGQQARGGWYVRLRLPMGHDVTAFRLYSAKSAIHNVTSPILTFLPWRSPFTHFNLTSWWLIATADGRRTWTTNTSGRRSRRRYRVPIKTVIKIKKVILSRDKLITLLNCSWRLPLFSVLTFEISNVLFDNTCRS